MKLVSSLLIASALASAVYASLASAQPVPPRLPSGTAKQPPALEGRPSAPVKPPTVGPFRPMCTPNPAVAPYQHTPVTCEEIQRARSFAPYLYNSCVTNVYSKIEELLKAMDGLDPFKVADATESASGFVAEAAAGGLAGYLITCTTEGFFAAVKGQFPSTESALVNSLEKAKGMPEVLRGRDPVAITRYIVDFRGSLEAARSEANNVREYFERGLYQSAYYQAHDAMTRSGNIVAASVSSATCDTIHADTEVRNATDLAMQHVVAMRRELAENGDKLRCAVEYLRTTALEVPHRQVQEMAIQRLTRDVREAGPQRIRDAEALLAETGRQCARVQEWAQRCADPPGTTQSAGVCAGQVAGDWRVTQRTATGRHEQDWTIAADGRAAPKGSQVPLQARGHVTDRRLVIAVRDGAGNYADHIVAELEPSCIRGTGSITTMISSQLGARKEQMEIRRLGDPSAVASPAGGPLAPPLSPGAAIVTPGVGPQISPQAGVPLGSPLPTQPPVSQPLGQQPVAPPPAAAPVVACNHNVGAPIYAKWAQLGGERGLLGCALQGVTLATTSPQGTPGTFARFQNGIITHMAGGARANQANEVHGRILEAYGQLGGSASWLGFPISDEYDVPGGRRSDFEGGALVWDRATNQVRQERAGAPPVAVGPPPASVSQPPPPQCDASGAWQAATDGVGGAIWNFAPTAPGRYAAREQGLGNATGNAIVSGTRLRVDWATGGVAGFYEWDLGPACGGGMGRLVFMQGRTSAHGSRIARAAQVTQPPVATEGHVGAPAGGRNYPRPQIAGAIVDWCVTWATNCGQAGADQFCRSQGHERAASFQTYSAGRTYVIGSRQICQGPHCVGFAQVTCAGGVKQ